MITRELLGKEVCESLYKDKNVAIQAATGVGKSKMALDAIKYIATKEHKQIKTLIVVAERTHINNWKSEINKWFPEFNSYLIICYASLKKQINTNWNCIIYDEAHHLQSDIRLSYFPLVKSEYKIFLSATLKERLIQTLELSCNTITKVNCKLKQAFDYKILSEPKIYLVPLTLDNKYVNQEYIKEWGKKDKRVTINCTFANRWLYIKNKKTFPNVKLVIKCTEAQAYALYNEEFNFWKNRYMSIRNPIVKNKWLQCGSSRKRFLGQLKDKEAAKIIEKLKDKRLIVFCTSIDQAEKLGNACAIHSKNPNSFKVIENFNNQEINTIFAVGMMTEGVNLNNIEASIIIQLDGEERVFIQKFGRVLRSKIPEQYILYYKDTRDEEYLSKALKDIDLKYINMLKQDEHFN